MKKRVKSLLQTISELYSYYRKPVYFGFIQGHTYLNDVQIGEIEKLIGKFDQNINSLFEKRYASLIGDGYATTLASGRMLFYVLLKVLNIKKDDEVILSNFTCSVMPNAVIRAGAKPVYSELDEYTYGSDPADIEKRITPKTKMIVAQHSFGIPCKIKEIREIADRHKIFLLEDSALTLGSEVDGIPVGNFGDASLFSMDHLKPINTMIGGLLFTKDKGLYDQIIAEVQKAEPLSVVHQKKLFRQFLLERKYSAPPNYGKLIALTKLKNALPLFLAKKYDTGFLGKDTSIKTIEEQSYPYPAAYPSFLAKLGLYELEQWQQKSDQLIELKKRYISLFKKNNLSSYLLDTYYENESIIPLRFLIKINNVEQMRSDLNDFLDIGMSWFVDPMNKSIANCNICKNREHFCCKSSINLPCNIDNEWAEYLLDVIAKAFKRHKSL